jgi:PKHD-type hydroxylase
MNLRPVFPHDTTINQTNYYWFGNGFTPVEVDKIVDLSKNFSFEKGTTVSTQKTDEARKSQIKWLPYDNSTEWIVDKLTEQIIEANQIWKFELSSVIDNIQYTEYDGNGGHYDWHLDIGPDNISHRKISVVVQLSQPYEYDGGKLQLKNGPGEIDVPQGKGTVIVFPSFLLHRVTPLTRGNRKSLVFWVGGGHYK